MRDNAIRYDTPDEERLQSLLAQERDGQTGGRRAGREKAIQTKTETERRPPSPYTVHTLDTAIAHLESAISADKAMAIFGASYWHSRVLELRCTPGILHIQERRLQCLLDRFAARAGEHEME
ncbi:hypothetical protein C7410_11761 [Paraburkholderia silvatlantica]|uniref:Uncharacterized protein n=1 Tax=Paraburkholderia silvatlantica TaxID=321895 RepID=A0A2V4UJC3_9BURK|nr:hypothetical protein [Paraburkholderia silvatlantica]PYE20371.1 hypothetical protein C7410_11761 [Paraburkholderia silvatlantica]